MRASHWSEKSAEDFCLSVRDGTHDSPKPTPYGKKLITSKNIIGGNINLENAYKISIEDAEKVDKRSLVEQWDVLISMIGTVGEVCLIKEKPDFSIKNIGLFKSKGKAEGIYLYYYLKSKLAKNYIENRLAGSTQKYISLTELRSMPIKYPENREEMYAINSTLSYLDDKIDLNRRTNETLEAMARALFRDWFVDFGPTRAKMAGEAPYLAPELWELFPDRLDDEGKPEGWQSLSLADLAILSKSSINPAQFSDEYFLHFSLPAFDKGMMPDLVKGEEIKSGKFSLPNNSILLSKLNPETPRVWMVTAHEEPYQRICSTEFIVLNPLQKDWLALIYCACLSQPFRETLQGMVTGTSKSHQRVQPLAVMQTHLLHATDILMRQFGLTAQPLFAKINFNRNESNTLAQFRDLLLPKLMSGEISIRDAEKMVEDAA